MFDLQEYLRKLDRLYADEQISEAEAYLKSGLREAASLSDDRAVYAILNELMGYYRVASRYEECMLCAKQAFSLAESMGISGSLDYGTMLINVATACRAAGDYDKAEQYYKEACEIFTDRLLEPDYRVASLHNNLSLLYGETGRLKEAKEELELAMELVKKMDDADMEIATTHTNLGNICFQMNQIREGTEHMKAAARIFETMPESHDAHYASALAGLGEAYYHSGKLAESIECYEKALYEIGRNYGKNDYYRVTERNLETVRDLQKRKDEFQKQGKNGLAIAREYYEMYGRPMILEKFPDYADRIAAGLVGEGSECLGFDDIYSTDHDYGPGFCLWLQQSDYDQIGSQLAKEYAKLPGEYMGFPARNTTEHGEARIGVFEIGSFYQMLTGHREAPVQGSQWLNIPQESLCSATNGAVFEDRLGVFTKQREAFSSYPESVRLKKLGFALGKMAQSGQYNYGRARKRKDIGAMYLSLSEFINAAIEAAYLINGIYMPFYKWRMRGMQSFTSLADMKPRLEEIMTLKSSDESIEERIEAICIEMVKELNRQGLSNSSETYLEAQVQEVWKAAGAAAERKDN